MKKYADIDLLLSSDPGDPFGRHKQKFNYQQAGSPEQRKKFLKIIGLPEKDINYKSLTGKSFADRNKQRQEYLMGTPAQRNANYKNFVETVVSRYPQLQKAYGKAGPRYLQQLYSDMMTSVGSLKVQDPDLPNTGIKPTEGIQQGGNWWKNIIKAWFNQPDPNMTLARVGDTKGTIKKVQDKQLEEQRKHLSKAYQHAQKIKTLDPQQQIAAYSTMALPVAGAAATPVALSSKFALPVTKFLLSNAAYMAGQKALSLGADQVFMPTFNNWTTDINSFADAILSKNSDKIPQRFRADLASQLGISEDKLDLSNPDQYKAAKQLFTSSQQSRMKSLDWYRKGKEHAALIASTATGNVSNLARNGGKAFGKQVVKDTFLPQLLITGSQLLDPKRTGITTGTAALLMQAAEQRGEDPEAALARYGFTEDEQKTAWDRFKQAQAEGKGFLDSVKQSVSPEAPRSTEEKVVQFNAGITPNDYQRIKSGEVLTNSPVIKAATQPYVPQVIDFLQGKSQLPDLTALSKGIGNNPLGQTGAIAAVNNLMQNKQVVAALAQAKPETLSKFLTKLQEVSKGGGLRKFPTLQKVMTQHGISLATYHVDALQNLVKGQEDNDKVYNTLKSYIPLVKILEGFGSAKDPRVKQLEKRVRSLIGTRMTKNPLFVNKAMGLWAQFNGHPDLASFLSSNGAFYGTLATVGIGLPLTISLMSSLFGGSKQQQPVQQAPMQGYQPMAYAPRGITERGLVVG